MHHSDEFFFQIKFLSNLFIPKSPKAWCTQIILPCCPRHQLQVNVICKISRGGLGPYNCKLLPVTNVQCQSRLCIHLWAVNPILSVWYNPFSASLLSDLEACHMPMFLCRPLSSMLCLHVSWVVPLTILHHFQQGATIVDQPVCITYWGQPEESFNFWDRPSWEVEEEIEYRVCISHSTNFPIVIS